MAFADPQSITINAIAKSLPRTGSGDNSGSFKKDDGEVTMSIKHAYGKRVRSVLRIDHTKISADPLMPSTNALYGMSVSLIVDKPVKAGYSPVEQKQIVDALVAYLSASSGARVTQFLGGES